MNELEEELDGEKQDVGSRQSNDHCTGLCLEGRYSEHTSIPRSTELPRRGVKVKKV